MEIRKAAMGWAAAAVLGAAAAQAADDPSIEGSQREDIQRAMRSFVAAQTAADGSWLHFDPLAGKLLRLQLESLHEGIVSKGHFYVSCADFRDEAGTLYDLDFLVVPGGEDGYRVQQAIVHKVGDAKRPYHVEQTWPGLF